jgi:transposase InsO family protein
VPWKETRVVDQRVEFIAALHREEQATGRSNMALACRRFGISRDTGYKWVARYQLQGPSGLVDRKSVPGRCPHRVDDEVESLVVELRKQWPDYGPKKLRAMLLDSGLQGVPAASTIGDVLERNGLVRPRRRRIRVPPSGSPLAHAQQPNDVWCVDFKGHFALGNGQRCHPLTITDAASRYLIKCESVVRPDDAHCRPHFERAFREFGVPARIRSDNGAPFATKALGGLSRLSVWWVQLGIAPERIEPGKPQQNGRHERFHLTLQQHTASPPKVDATSQQRAFDRFRHEYNDVRPHEALGQTPPGRHYEPSLRPMPEAKTPEYDPDMTQRWVTPGGEIHIKGRVLYVSNLLAKQPVGLRQVDDDEWELFYGPLHLGDVLIRKREARIEPLR